MSKINLSEYECQYNQDEYNKVYEKFFKKFIPKNIKPSKVPTIQIYMGIPGSGKSTLAKMKNFQKDYVNLDGDIFIDNLPEMIKLLKKGVKHGNAMKSCSAMGMDLLWDLYRYCLDKKYNVIMHMIYGADADFLDDVKKYGYSIESFWIFSKNAWKNNKNRPGLNLSKRIYLTVLQDMLNELNQAITTLKKSDFSQIIESKGNNEFVQLQGNPKKIMSSAIYNVVKSISSS